MSRRFIAGAVCPRCGEMDKLLVDTQSNKRECVRCGFSDARPNDVTQEPATRVNRPAARLIETPAEAVRLVDPNQGSSTDNSNADEGDTGSDDAVS